jgi:hypothetical protein
MTLLYLFGAVVFAAVVFWWWQGVGALNALERGEHGPFGLLPEEPVRWTRPSMTCVSAVQPNLSYERTASGGR